MKMTIKIDSLEELRSLGKFLASAESSAEPESKGDTCDVESVLDRVAADMDVKFSTEQDPTCEVTKADIPAVGISDAGVILYDPALVNSSGLSEAFDAIPEQAEPEQPEQSTEPTSKVGLAELKDAAKTLDKQHVLNLLAAKFDITGYRQVGRALAKLDESQYDAALDALRAANEVMATPAMVARPAAEPVAEPAIDRAEIWTDLRKLSDTHGRSSVVDLIKGAGVVVSGRVADAVKACDDTTALKLIGAIEAMRQEAPNA